MKRIIFIGMAALMITGCATRIADLTVVSTKNFNMNSGNFGKGERVVGKSNIPVVIFPLGVPNLKEAVDNAIEKNACAVGLSNVVIYNYNYSFFFGVTGISVKGDLIVDNNQPGCGGYSVNAPYVNKPIQNTYIDTGSEKEQKLQALKSQNLSYEEYQRRYQEIMGE